MEAVTVVTRLLRQLKLGTDELQQRLEFLDWGAADVERLGAVAGDARPLNNAYVDELYETLGRFSEPARILNDPATVGRLKEHQRNYYQRLFSGDIDDDYLRDRVRIGQIHEQVGVELKWYLGAYRLYLSQMLRGLSPVGTSIDAFLNAYDSLLKIVFFDMTLAAEAYVQAQHRALEASKARYAHALRGANDGIWDWDLDSGALYVSQRWASMLGLAQRQIGETPEGWFALVHPDDLPGLRQAIDEHVAGRSAWIRHEYRIRQCDASYLWVLARGILEQDAMGHRRLAGSQTDVSERKRFQQQLEQSARCDPLTGLSNRTHLNQLLHQTAQRLSRSVGRHAALLFIDLDRFKLINDSLGHAAGDRVLVAVAERLKTCLRSTDHLARFGGDEFVMLLDDLVRSEDAELVAARVLATLREPLVCGNRSLIVNASIGVAPLLPGQGLETALQAADIALYNAKDDGKARFKRYDLSMQEKVVQRLQLETNVLQALTRNEFTLRYQPIFDLDQEDGALPVGVEALLRWEHGAETISPARFIPVLEESGEIIPVGYWVLEQACRQVRQWQQAGFEHFRCSVNLSSLQLRDEGFVSRVEDILRRTGLPPSTLVLEITESLLLDQGDSTMLILGELTAMGVRMALDDFGTGYCSLSYLNRFPLHILKLDRSFLLEARHDSRQQAICRAIIGLSHNLGLDVIAEGIEESEQVAFLREEHCRFGQGFWLARPASVNEMTQLLQGYQAP